LDATFEEEFWTPILENTDFKEFVKKQYTIGYKSILNMEEVLEIADLIEDPQDAD